MMGRKRRKDYSSLKAKSKLADYFARQLVDKGMTAEQFKKLMGYKKR